MFGLGSYFALSCAVLVRTSCESLSSGLEYSKEHEGSAGKHGLRISGDCTLSVSIGREGFSAVEALL